MDSEGTGHLSLYLLSRVDVFCARTGAWLEQPRPTLMETRPACIYLECRESTRQNADADADEYNSDRPNLSSGLRTPPIDDTPLVPARRRS